MKTLSILLLLAASASAAITGRVTDAEGRGVPGVTVRAYSECSKTVTAVTGPRGGYTIPLDRPCYVTWVRPEGVEFFAPNAAIFLFFPVGRADFVLQDGFSFDRLGM